jgi:hypothetical protein
MFKKFVRQIKKAWILLFLFVTFTPQVLAHCQRIVSRTME